MGKLKDLKKELKDCVDEDRIEELRKAINDIELWMVEKGHLDKITIFSIKPGTEDPKNCAICGKKSNTIQPCVQTLYNQITRRICSHCFTCIENGMKIYRENNL